MQGKNLTTRLPCWVQKCLSLMLLFLHFYSCCRRQPSIGLRHPPVPVPEAEDFFSFLFSLPATKLSSACDLNHSLQRCREAGAANARFSASSLPPGVLSLTFVVHLLQAGGTESQVNVQLVWSRLFPVPGAPWEALVATTYAFCLFPWKGLLFVLKFRFLHCYQTSAL